MRICSAGCSTGQEAYSLAITLKELIPDFHKWNILILGIDIDRLALKEAQKAIYANWSFRGPQPRIKREYFQKINNQYHLNADIKNMVEFRQINLITEPLPQINTVLSDMDLIICRNVFIYFDKNNIKYVLDKMYNMLKPLGYFIAGHTELTEQNLSKFQTLVFSQSLVYQKTKETPTNKGLKPIVLEKKNQNNNKKIASQITELKVTNFTPQIQSNLN